MSPSDSFKQIGVQKITNKQLDLKHKKHSKLQIKKNGINENDVSSICHYAQALSMRNWDRSIRERRSKDPVF